MNKIGASYIAGFINLVAGIIIAGVDISISCIKKGTDTLYDTSFTCINQSSFWIIIVIGTIIAIIGAYMCQHSN